MSIQLIFVTHACSTVIMNAMINSAGSLQIFAWCIKKTALCVDFYMAIPMVQFLGKNNQWKLSYESPNIENM